MSSDMIDTGTGDEDIIPVPLTKALSERYLTYALSTIMHRALPDVRDGLKPVHRRILYAMRELKLDPSHGPKKSAKVVGEVMGNYHPHGDSAIYDAMVRLAQDFSVRYPLIDGQGNFGNVDGDNAAAMRYTESRLTEIAWTMLEGLDENAVDFNPTYDEEDEEPDVLPAAFPNLLANGASGIAVGMATNIPPHNLDELCQAVQHLIKFPNAGIDKLVELVPGPDFPTGGIIIEPRDSLMETYRTGKGSIRIRARWHKEDGPRGTYQIIITEIPYQVQKSKLIEKIADLINSKKVPLLTDVRDESAEDIRVVLEPKSRSVPADALMETLFRLTDLETRFSLNMNVLNAKQVPGVMSLREVLRAFIDHRREVLLRRTGFRLEKIARRLELVGGYIIAFLNLDRVIEIIREEDEPKPVLMAEFNLSDVQAEAILNMRLRSLRKLEEMELRAERQKLLEEQTELTALLDDPAGQDGRLVDEIKDIRKRFGKDAPGGARRSALETAPDVEDIPLEAMVEREPITIICSEKGWIRAMRGHLAPHSEFKFRDGDEGRFVIHAETVSKLLMVSNTGKAYTLNCDKLPGGRGTGEPVRLMIDMAGDDDIAALFVHSPGEKRVIASTAGRGFVVEEDAMIAQTRSGRQVLNVSAPDRVAACVSVEGDTLAVVGENRKVLVYPLSELPEMGRGKGITLQKYKDGGLSDIKTFELRSGLSWKDPAGRTRTETDLTEWLGRRASTGRMAPRGFPRENKFT